MQLQVHYQDFLRKLSENLETKHSIKTCKHTFLQFQFSAWLISPSCNFVVCQLTPMRSAHAHLTSTDLHIQRTGSRNHSTWVLNVCSLYNRQRCDFWIVKYPSIWFITLTLCLGYVILVYVWNFVSTLQHSQPILRSLLMYRCQCYFCFHILLYISLNIIFSFFCILSLMYMCFSIIAFGFCFCLWMQPLKVSFNLFKP